MSSLIQRRFLSFFLFIFLLSIVFSLRLFYYFCTDATISSLCILLNFRLPVFWAHVLYSSSLRVYLHSFLLYASRPHDLSFPSPSRSYSSLKRRKQERMQEKTENEEEEEKEHLHEQKIEILRYLTLLIFHRLSHSLSDVLVSSSSSLKLSREIEKFFAVSPFSLEKSVELSSMRNVFHAGGREEEGGGLTERGVEDEKDGQEQERRRKRYEEEEGNKNKSKLVRQDLPRYEGREGSLVSLRRMIDLACIYEGAPDVKMIVRDIIRSMYRYIGQEWEKKKEVHILREKLIERIYTCEDRLHGLASSPECLDLLSSEIFTREEEREKKDERFSSFSPSSLSCRSLTWEREVLCVLSEIIDMMACVRALSRCFPESIVSEFWKGGHISSRERFDQDQRWKERRTGLGDRTGGPDGGEDNRLMRLLQHLYVLLMSLPWIRLWECPSTPSLLRLALGRSRQYICACILQEAQRLWSPRDTLSPMMEGNRASDQDSDRCDFLRRGRRDLSSDKRGSCRGFSGHLRSSGSLGDVEEENEKALEEFTEWSLHFRDEVYQGGGPSCMKWLARDMRRAQFLRLLHAWNLRLQHIGLERIQHIEEAICPASERNQEPARSVPPRSESGEGRVSSSSSFHRIHKEETSRKKKHAGGDRRHVELYLHPEDQEKLELIRKVVSPEREEDHFHRSEEEAALFLTSEANTKKKKDGEEKKEDTSGLGFMYLCLLYCRGNADETINLLLDQQLPPILQHVRPSLSLQGAVEFLRAARERSAEASSDEPRGAEAEAPMLPKDEELKSQILSMIDARRQQSEARRLDEALPKKRFEGGGKEGDNDRFCVSSSDEEDEDDFSDVGEILSHAPCDLLHSEYEDEENDEEEDEEEKKEKESSDSKRSVVQGGKNGDNTQHSSSGGASRSDHSSTSRRGGRGGMQGQPQAGTRTPVRGQTLQARRKEENKGKRANHNRKGGHLAKMRRGMIF
ncbi:hypothetical protein CSUI_003225 [Cystoisospora suis]|uniref:Transmembrane protein n=1 Tax=Cystoisospora suis TaxID=483139 RepID=A0A2C6L551_9APIC|nr:hypothetical protein CSUI_003225 [Cystoisospora suis]